MSAQSEGGAQARTLITAIRERRAVLAEDGFASDRDNTDPAANLALLARIGAARLVVPAEYGAVGRHGTRGMGLGHPGGEGGQRG